MIIVLLFCSADKIILSIREGSTQVLSFSFSENQFGVQKISSELPRKLKNVKIQFTIFFRDPFDFSSPRREASFSRSGRVVTSPVSHRGSQDLSSNDCSCTIVTVRSVFFSNSNFNCFLSFLLSRHSLCFFGPAKIAY